MPFAFPGGAGHGGKVNKMETGLGDFLISFSVDASEGLSSKALSPARWPGKLGEAPSLTVRTPAPGVSIAYSGDVLCVADSNRGGLGLARAPAQGRAGSGPAPENAPFGFRPVYFHGRQRDDSKVWSSAHFIEFG